MRGAAFFFLWVGGVREDSASSDMARALNKTARRMDNAKGSRSGKRVSYWNLGAMDTMMAFENWQHDLHCPE